jgi:hypothetical protein
VELHACPPRFVSDVSERPVASPLAQLQAEAGGQVTNLRHETVPLSDLERQLVRLLDGTRDRSALRHGLEGLVGQGVLEVRDGGGRLQDLGRVRAALAGALDQSLPELARAALLVA